MAQCESLTRWMVGWVFGWLLCDRYLVGFFSSLSEKLLVFCFSQCTSRATINPQRTESITVVKLFGWIGGWIGKLLSRKTVYCYLVVPFADYPNECFQKKELLIAFVFHPTLLLASSWYSPKMKAQCRQLLFSFLPQFISLSSGFLQFYSIIDEPFVKLGIGRDEPKTVRGLVDAVGIVAELFQ